MNFEFKRYEMSNSIKGQCNKVWSFMERHGCPNIVDKMAVRSVYAGRHVLGDAEANEFISKGIAGDDGFMVARFGAVELNYIYYFLRMKMGYVDEKQRVEALRMLCFNAGFFPSDFDMADKVAELYLDAAAQVDLCGAWSIYMEDYVLQKYAGKSAITKLRFLEPWSTKSGSPWTKALANKKVMVIHPFSESMKKQYLNRTELFRAKFDKDDILPEMDLKFIKAVQSIGGEGASGFSNWFEAYNYMLDEIQQSDFDVAILGCGAYGFPLASEIKKMGKKAIHFGGATQSLFGIKGKRFDNDPIISSFYNEYWISPSDAEKPANADGVEGGCYW